MPLPSPTPPNRAPLLWLLLPYMAGLLAGWAKPLPATVGWATCFIAAALAGVAIWAAIGGHRRWWIVTVMLASAVTGWTALLVRYPHLSANEARPPREVTITIKVRQLFPGTPRSKSFSGLGQVADVARSYAELQGRPVYFSAIRRISVSPRPGASYLIKGVLEPLVESPSAAGFSEYLGNLGIRQQISRAQLVREIEAPGRFQSLCLAGRGRLETFLQRGLSGHPELNSIYVAMLLGQRQVLSAEQKNSFMRSGTFHVFSISGLHVGVIALALHSVSLVLRLPRRPAIVFTLATLWIYVQITGASTPALRAFVMVACVHAAKAFRLPANPLSALTLAALITLLVEPLQLFSPGFQMSYAVVSALLLMGGPLAAKWQTHWQPFALRPRPEWRWWHQRIRDGGGRLIMAGAGCWTAFLASAVTGIGVYQLFSPGSLPANLIIIPLASLTIIAGFLSLLSGLVGVESLCELFNAAAGLLIMSIQWLVHEVTTLPGVYFPAHFRADWLAPLAQILMIAVFISGASVRWSPRYGGFWPPAFGLLMLLLLAVRFG